VVDVLERELVAWLDPAGEIRIAARDEHEVALDGAPVEPPGPIDARVESVVGAEELEGGSLGEELRRRRGGEELVRVVRPHHPPVA